MSPKRLISTQAKRTTLLTMRVYCPLCRMEIQATDAPHQTLNDCTQALAEAELILEDRVRRMVAKKAKLGGRMPALGESATSI